MYTCRLENVGHFVSDRNVSRDLHCYVLYEFGHWRLVILQRCGVNLKKCLCACELCVRVACWRHQMETFSALLALCAGNSPVTGEFPSQRPVTRSFNVFFDLHLDKRLSKQSWDWWFETPSSLLWRHCHGLCVRVDCVRVWIVCACGYHVITVTSKWAQWRLKSQGSDYLLNRQRKQQSSASLAFVRGIHRWPVDSPHKGPITGKMFQFNDVIMRIRLSMQSVNIVLCQTVCAPMGVSIKNYLFSQSRIFCFSGTGGIVWNFV